MLLKTWCDRTGLTEVSFSCHWTGSLITQNLIVRWTAEWVICIWLQLGYPLVRDCEGKRKCEERGKGKNKKQRLVWVIILICRFSLIFFPPGLGFLLLVVHRALEFIPLTTAFHLPWKYTAQRGVLDPLPQSDQASCECWSPPCMLHIGIGLRYLMKTNFCLFCSLSS